MKHKNHPFYDPITLRATDLRIFLIPYLKIISAILANHLEFNCKFHMGPFI